MCNEENSNLQGLKEWEENSNLQGLKEWRGMTRTMEKKESIELQGLRSHPNVG